MAIAAESPRSTQGSDPRWPSAEQLRGYAPLVRLLTVIWSVPEVLRLGLSTGGENVTVWAFMAEDNAEAESRISLAEREFLNSGTATVFEVQVVPLSDVPETAIPPYDLILER